MDGPLAFILSIVDLDIRRVQSFHPLAIMVFNFDNCSKSGWPAEPACWRPVFVHYWGKSYPSPFIVFRVQFCVQDEGFITFDYGAEGDEEGMVEEEEMEWLAEALQFLFQTS